MKRSAWAFLLVAAALVLGGGMALAVTQTGGSGADAIIGTDGPDRLSGRGGNDSILGKDGDDDLFGGRGVDALSGGAGDDGMIAGPVDETSGDALSGGAGDLIDVSNIPAAEDDVSCGSGFDRVEADAEDEIADDCERVNRL